MHIGHYISGSAHIGLLSWMLLGGVFQSEQLPMEVSNVSVVSLSEYADIVMTDRAPEAELQPQDLMQQEAEADSLPERPSEEQAVENIPQPELMAQPEDPSRSAPQTPDPLLVPNWTHAFCRWYSRLRCVPGRDLSPEQSIPCRMGCRG